MLIPFPNPMPCVPRDLHKQHGKEGKAMGWEISPGDKVEDVRSENLEGKCFLTFLAHTRHPW